jgi:GMP synthase (glutamine-hydrolysing)
MKALILDNTESLTSEDQKCILPLINLVSHFAHIEIVSYRDTSNLEEILKKTGAIAVVGSGVPIIGYGIESIEDRAKRLRPFLHNTNTSMFGICITHQAIGRACGSLIATNKEVEDGNCMVEVNSRVDPIFQGLPDNFGVETEHYCSISLPPNFIHLASSENCFNNMMRHPTKNIISTQAHPERPTENGGTSVGKIIMGNFIDSAERHAFDLAIAA